MSLLVSIGWAVGLVLVGLVLYVIACTAVLSILRLPDEGVFVVVEDALFVLTLPFVVAVVLLPAIRR